MDNKQQVDKLRDNAELAWASYGYFHCVGNKFDIKDENKIVSLENVLDITYKNSKIIDEKGFKLGKLDGDFSPTQAKRFFERYDLLEHCPNTNSGFSATLFKDLGEFDKKTNTRNAVDKDSQYILSIRGTELSTNKTEETAKDLHTDFLLGTNRHTKQYFDMIDFIETKVKPIIYDDITQSYAKMTIVGHSLGGYLAQMFALSYSHLVDKVYTYNAPGIFNDDTEKLFNQLKNVATLFPPIQSLVVGSIIANSIISLFESQVNIQAYEMLQTSSDTGLYCGMIEINETLFQRIESYQSNSKRLLAIKGTDNSALQLKHTIPYFLRTDQEEISLENSKINGVRKIFYIPSMQEYAQKLYDKIKAYRDTHKGQTFYVYYAYAFVHTATQAKICESNTIILDYDLHIPFGSLGNQFKSLRQNNAYTPNTLAQEQFFHIISKDLNSECDIIGNLGIKALGERYEIQIGKTGFINTHSIIPLTQTLYLYSYLLDSQSNYDKVKDKDINECIEYLNTFMQGVYKVFNPLSIVINNKNLTPYKTQKKKPDSTDFLPTFIEYILYVTSLEKERE
ncbi:lipase family protein, partial [Helicobacter cinaedi]